MRPASNLKTQVSEMLSETLDNLSPISTLQTSQMAVLMIPTRQKRPEPAKKPLPKSKTLPEKIRELENIPAIGAFVKKAGMSLLTLLIVVIVSIKWLILLKLHSRLAADLLAVIPATWLTLKAMNAKKCELDWLAYWYYKSHEGFALVQ
jgi:hypothetical protein